MQLVTVTGATWGDEGKGRVVDYLAEQADVVVRFQGGSNAGHTLVTENGRTFHLHLIPCGALHSHTLNVLGPGMVINPEQLVAELEMLRQAGFDPRLAISELATIVMPFHVEADKANEALLKERAIGSTRQGVGPAYVDRAARRAIRFADLDSPDLTMRIQDALDAARPDSPRSVSDTLAWVHRWTSPLEDFIVDTRRLLSDEYADARVLAEAQLGALRDRDHGIYPWVTSSHTLSRYAVIGGGLPRPSKQVNVAVIKAFSSMVGAGPMPVENRGAWADQLRQRTGEFGATTNRPRRLGPFDAVAVRHGLDLQEADHVAMTRLDSLSGETRLEINTHYRVGDEVSSRYPLDRTLERCAPVFECYAAWSHDCQGTDEWRALPVEARRYVEAIETSIGRSIDCISTGPKRHDLIERDFDVWK